MRQCWRWPGRRGWRRGDWRERPAGRPKPSLSKRQRQRKNVRIYNNRDHNLNIAVVVIGGLTFISCAVLVY